ncbi:hypothetical protein ACKS9G_001964 [Cronobacter turicensis]
MTNTNELTAKLKAAPYQSRFARLWERYDEASHDNAEHMRDILKLTLEALEAAEKRNAELERERAALRPVGVMSEAAFHRLEASECRFIALWPRPGIYLPRSRPKDGVVVYARTGLAGINLETGG